MPISKKGNEYQKPWKIHNKIPPPKNKAMSANFRYILILNMSSIFDGVKILLKKEIEVDIRVCQEQITSLKWINPQGLNPTNVHDCLEHV